MTGGFLFVSAVAVQGGSVFLVGGQEPIAGLWWDGARVPITYVFTNTRNFGEPWVNAVVRVDDDARLGWHRVRARSPSGRTTARVWVTERDPATICPGLRCSMRHPDNPFSWVLPFLEVDASAEAIGLLAWRLDGAERVLQPGSGTEQPGRFPLVVRVIGHDGTTGPAWLVDATMPMGWWQPDTPCMVAPLAPPPGMYELWPPPPGSTSASSGL